ncbi:MAG: 3-hydroxyacyl-CoA dehydrogenase [Archaeoglobaceae archaeon]|nr:3-hydroxyacyl-CoA dehydrogenase [Archaeoglobaceae archaeon]MDW8117650.1 3-hydroxyacyl-CoA dehydrogenase NAD-binding domain-containing protein [Archaeoglobaceae archaeon]
MEIVGIAGAGTMGSAISALFANAGYEVVLYDISEEALKRAKSRNSHEHLIELEKAGLRLRETLDNIEYTTNFSDLKGCDLLLETIKEDLDIKIQFFKKIASICKNAIFATNTSSYMPSEISEGAKVSVFLFHFSNPPIEMPLVEISGEGDVKKLVEYAERIGKKPVVLKKQCRGHVLNRMLCALGISLGYALKMASPYEIDASIKLFGFKYGLFEIFDRIGLDISLDVLKSLEEAYPRFSSDFTKDVLKQFVESGKLGKKSGEGFYKWAGEEPIAENVEGYPDVTILLGVIINEAFRMIEEGIADKETINEVWKLATLSPGIFDLAKLIGYENLISNLEKAYKESGAEIFKPMIRKDLNF